MTALIVCGCIALYAMMIGISFKAITRYGNNHYWDDAEFAACFMCVIWPIAGLIVLGLSLGDASAPNLSGSILTQKGRTQRRQEAEQLAMDHRIEIARKINKENELLDIQLSESRR